MRRILATCASVGLTVAFALPVPAVAAEKRADGVRNIEQTEVSAKRKRYRAHRAYGPRHGDYRPYRPYYYDAPYYAYSPGYYGYRPYYRPGVSVGVGPFGFGF